MYAFFQQCANENEEFRVLAYCAFDARTIPSENYFHLTHGHIQCELLGSKTKLGKLAVFRSVGVDKIENLESDIFFVMSTLSLL